MNQATLKELDRQKIVTQLVRLSEHAQKNKWQYDYDPEVDELVYGISVMPDDSFLFSLNRELNLFLTPNSDVKGIFIEYFASNYIEHNQELRPALKVLEKKNNDKEKVTLAKEALEGKLLAQALETLLEKDKLLAAVI